VRTTPRVTGMHQNDQNLLINLHVPEPIQTASSATKQIVEFDFLRTVAILLLFLHHGGIYNFSVFSFSLENFKPFIEQFLLGSFVFMAGYLSVNSLEKNSFGEFFKKRLIRIYLPYLVALVLFVLLLDLDVSKLDFVIHLAGAQILLSPEFTDPILTLWYIGLILTFYVIFGFLYKSIKSPAYLLIAVVLIFAITFTLRLEWGIISRRFFYYFFIFAAGILCAKSRTLRVLTTDRFFFVDKLLLLLFGIIFYGFYANYEEFPISLPSLLAMDIYILAAVITLLSVARLYHQYLSNVRLISIISYSAFFAYLFHRPVWDALLSIYTPPTLQLLSVYQILVGSAIVIILSFVLQKAYDQISLRLIDKQPLSKASSQDGSYSKR
jgi:peptidoglycan/LPS O-acetylase OafA/YrhL